MEPVNGCLVGPDDLPDSDDEYAVEDTQVLPPGVPTVPPELDVNHPPLSPSTNSHVEPVTEPSLHPIVDKLRQQLAEMGLDTRGRRQDLQRRLRNALKRAAVDERSGSRSPCSVKRRETDGEESPNWDDPWKEEGEDKRVVDGWGDEEEEEGDAELGERPEGAQPYDYYCVLDVEATCEEEADWDYPNEIIEWPVILIDGRTMEVVGEFHEFVRPVMQPQLSSFCVQLTGITQEVVDAASTFPVVLGNFERWLRKYSRYPFPNVLFICDGPWDIRDFVRKQCEKSILDRPPYLRRFVDLRRLYVDFYKRERANLCGMLHAFGMSFEGREHSGVDDARNISRIVLQMMKDGCMIRENTELKMSKRKVGRKGRVLFTKGSNQNEQWTRGMHITI
ncbi:3'-5' exoribonuclease 1 [Borealophlyctis nickersoniae]|nr:3'-5' exoribonuclease 1 [Borealophlyctis nickersoniae]